jgi:predicted flap endonuclease-1-like 5' DNA nuclease
MTLTLAQAITVAILALSSFFCGWFFYRLRAKAREAELTRTLLDAKGVIPQLESTVRNRDQRVSALCVEVGDWKNRHATTETALKEKEREVLARDRALRALNAELAVLKEAEATRASPAVDGTDYEGLQASLAAAEARCQELESRLTLAPITAEGVAAPGDSAAPLPAPDAETEAHHAQIESLESELAARDRALAELETRLQTQVAHDGELSDRFEAQEAEIQRGREEIAKWQARVPKLVDAAREKDERLRQAAQREETLARELKQATARHSALELALDQERARLANATRTLTELRSMGDAAIQERDDLRRANAAAQTTLESREAELERARAEADQARTDAADARRSVAAAQSEFAKKLATSIRLGREEVDRLNREMDRLTHELGAAITARNDSAEDRAALDELARSRAAELERLRGERDAAIAQASTVDAERLDLVQRMQGLDAELEHLQARNAELSGDLSAALDRLTQAETETDEMRSGVAATAAAVAERDALLAEREVTLSDRTAALNAVQAEVEQTRAQLVSISAMNEAHARDITERNALLSARDAELAQRTTALNEAQQELEHARSQLASVSAAQDQHERVVAEAHVDLEARSAEVAELRAELRQWHARLAPLENLIKQRDETLAVRARRIEELQAQIAGLENTVIERSQKAGQRERDLVAAQGGSKDPRSDYLETRIANQFEKNRELTAALEERNKALAALAKDCELKDKSLAVLHQQLEQERESTERLAGQLRELRARDGTVPQVPDDSVAPEQPQGLFDGRPEEVDDLQLIRGIGAAFEHRLNSLGIFQHRQIAGLSDAEIVWLEDELRTFRGRIGRDDWIGQAVALMQPPPTSTAVVPVSSKRL